MPSKYGDRAVEQLEKAGGLKGGNLYKFFEDIEEEKLEAQNKGEPVPTTFIKSGYVLKTVGNKIIIQSQPMTLGTKVALGAGVVVVLTGAGYDIVWAINNWNRSFFGRGGRKGSS